MGKGNFTNWLARQARLIGVYGLMAGAVSLAPLHAQAKLAPDITAGAPVYKSALSARIVRFIADPANTYVLYLRPGMVTDVKLPRGESLKALALGDTVQWVTQQVPGTGDVFIKPVQPGIQTSATLVTSGHTYQLMLVSRAKGDWYQEVRFQPRMPLVYASTSLPAGGSASRSPTPSSAGADTTRTHGALPAALAEGGNSGTQGVADQSDKGQGDVFAHLNLKDLQFGWTWQGKTDFSPVRVFSSPDFVWIQLPVHARSPVVFAREDGQWGIVNYDYRGRWIVVQTRSRVLRLRAGTDSVDVYAPGAQPKQATSGGAVQARLGPG